MAARRAPPKVHFGTQRWYFLLSIILGPEMGAPILWAPEVFPFFVQENLHVHKFLVLGGGGILAFLVGIR